jgi:glyoxylase-like metal-dependent hydrolase (beta-lactamase superfamily II)
LRFQLVRPGVYQLTDQEVNVFLLDCQGLTLIDTGHPSSGEVIVEALRELGHDPSLVSRILLTHVHPDHAGSAAFLKKRLGAEVLCHRFDAELLEEGVAVRKSFGPAPGLLNRLLYRAFIARAAMEIPKATVDRFLSEGEEVIGGIRAIHTPGHSAGHLAYLWRDTLILGDAALHVGWLRAGIATENYDQALQSIQRLCDFKFEVACFGHGPPITKNARRRFRARQWWSGPNPSGALNFHAPLSP